MVQKNQPETKLPFKPLVDEMGFIPFPSTPHQVSLFNSFVEEIHPLLTRKGEFLPLQQRETMKTNICCPFCQEGLLVLVKTEPIYSGGARPVPHTYTKYHVGNIYKFVCSNEQCDGKFFGSYTWMHID